MNLAQKIESCRILMSEVDSNKSKATADLKKSAENTKFFNLYDETISVTLFSYVFVKKILNYNFSPEIQKEFNSCVDEVSRILDSKQVLNIGAFNKRIHDIGSRITSEWTSYSDNATKDYIERLGMCRMFFSNKMEVDRISNAIKAIRKWPLNKKTIEEYIEAKGKAEEIFSKINFDKEVEAFLKKIYEKSATMLDLSDHIINWIKENKFEGNLMLSIKT